MKSANGMKSKNGVGGFIKRHKLTLAGVALALLALKAVAETLPPDPGMHLQRTFDRVEASLSLTDEQAQAWAVAESATLAQLKSGMEQRKSIRDTVRSTLSENEPDLHALSDNLLNDMETHLAERKTNHDVWLSVYDSLTAEQQVLARKAVLAELTKMENKHHKGQPPMDSGHRMRAPASSF